MRKEKRALSWEEFLKSGYQDSDYRYPDFEGTYEAALVCKRWGKRNCLFVYLDMLDGRKILTAAWSDKGYLGLADMPVGSRITVTFVRASTGKTYLRSVGPASEGGVLLYPNKHRRCDTTTAFSQGRSPVTPLLSEKRR